MIKSSNYVAPDFKAIVDELLDSTYVVSEDCKKSLSMSANTILQEFCTVGFSSHRQNGKTTWIIDQLMVDDKAIVIFGMTDFRCHGGSEAYEKLRGKELSDSVKDRMFSAFEIDEFCDAASMGNEAGNRLPQTLTHVYVDDSYQFFDKVHRNKFFQLMATRGTDFKIILIS